MNGNAHKCADHVAANQVSRLCKRTIDDAIDEYRWSAKRANQEDIVSWTEIFFINKTNDFLKIDTNHEGDGEVEIYSITGQSVLKKTINFTKGNQSEIEISRLPKGLYIVNIKDDKGTYSKKVLKQ